MRNVFRKSKVFKVVAVLTVMSFAGSSSVFANYPVIDISNLMNAIQQLYSTYDMINTTIEQVQNTYQQLQTQINSVKSMDWDNLKDSFSEDKCSSEGGLKGAWDNIGNFRTNLTDATSVINENMNLINDVKHTLENKTVTCMGKKYTVAGLFGIGKYGQNNLLGMPLDALDYVKQQGEEIAKGYEGKLTYREKQAIMNKWGLDPENYAYVKLVEEQTNSLINDLIVEGSGEHIDAQLAKAAKNNEALLALSQNADDSIVAGIQASAGATIELKNMCGNIWGSLQKYGAAYAEKSVEEKLRKEAEQEAKRKEIERRQQVWEDEAGFVPSWL